MNDLLILRDAVVGSLRNKLGGGVSVEPHGGTFALEDLKRFALLAPAVRVAIVGVGKGSRFNDGRWQVPVHFAAVAITRDAVAPERITRDVGALLLVGALELSLASNRFGLEGVRQAEAIEARNEYSGPVETMGVALWQVTWTTPVLLGEPGDPADVVIAHLTKALVNGETYWSQGAGFTGSAEAA